MKNTILKILHVLRKCFWFITRPETKGVRAIVLNNKNQILLVKHTYLSGWFLPGGKAKKNEDSRDALKRELKEELGVDIFEEVKFLGIYSNNFEFKKDEISVFVIKISDLPENIHFEIKDKKFFNYEEVPDGTSPGTNRRIKEWFHNETVSENW